MNVYLRMSELKFLGLRYLNSDKSDRKMEQDRFSHRSKICRSENKENSRLRKIYWQ